MCIFEYDEKREKELIRKVEYAEGKREGAEQIFTIYRLHKEKYTEQQIAEQMDHVGEVKNVLERLK
ncbi:MAG: hypothetical protein V8S58_09500 [Lachnospiraceae bacterium]